MTATRKRRWLLVAVAVALVAVVVGFIVFREDPKDDLPRLVISEQWDMKAKKPVVFRLDAPNHMTAWLVRMSTQNPSTGQERKAMLQVAGDIRYEVLDVGTQIPDVGRQFTVNPHLGVEAGQSREFHVLPPVDEVWRLRCQVGLTDTGTMESLRICVGVVLANEVSRSLALENVFRAEDSCRY